VAWPGISNGGGYGGVWGRSATLGDFCNFSTKITHLYAYFAQNSYLKATIH